jgi:hypothetical protein
LTLSPETPPDPQRAQLSLYAGSIVVGAHVFVAGQRPHHPGPRLLGIGCPHHRTGIFCGPSSGHRPSVQVSSSCQEVGSSLEQAPSMQGGGNERRATGVCAGQSFGPLNALLRIPPAV